jgi:transposase
MDYHINNQQWEEIYSFLQTIKGLHSHSCKNLRLFIEEVWFVLRTGIQWRHLPEWYEAWSSVHRKFKRWSDRGLWQQLFTKVQREPDLEHIMMDSTIVRAHACAAGLKKESQNEEALGRSKGGFTTKIHAVVDGLGNPLRFHLTAGQRQDITQAHHMIQDFSESKVLADKGYDAKTLIDQLEQQNCETVIPPKKNRKEQRFYDRDIYKERHLIECFFGKLKHYRRVFSRFEKSASAFLSFLCFAGALIWLR